MLHENDVAYIEGLYRIEKMRKEELMGTITELTHAVYPHEELYHDFCPVHSYVNCPPEEVFDYMSKIESLEEWTYSLRGFRKAGNDKDLYVGKDQVGGNTDIYCKIKASKEALTVDYHCAWDQGDDLWMIYLNRIVPAELVLNKPGSVIFWQNCRHPYYDENPYPEKAPRDRKIWVGEMWDFFYAGHTVELNNLVKILEHRYQLKIKQGR